MTSPRDARTLLGLPPTASPAQVRRAFRQLVLELHPDRHQGDPQQAARLRAVVEAYEELTGKRPKTRARSRSARSPWTSSATGATRQDTAPPPPPRPRERFACPRCLDTWAYDAECPRCDLPLVDELRGPVRPCADDPQVAAMLEALERGAPPSEWATRLHARVPVTAISSLLAGGVLALPIHAPVAAMLLGYGLFLFAVEAYGAASRAAPL